MKITEAKHYFIFESLKQVVLNFKQKWQKLLAGTCGERNCRYLALKI
jgi:hypothetical protein